MLIGVYSDDPIDEGTPYLFNDYLELLKSGERKSHYPIEMFVAMSRNKSERKDAGLSATTLLSCPRFVVLSELNDFFEWPKDYWHRFRGTIGHLMFEAYDEDDPDVIRETRFRKSILVDGEEVEITGKLDKYNKRTKFYLDYKSIIEVPKLPKPSHEPQANIYAWLLDGGVDMTTGQVVNYEVEAAGIQYFDMSVARKRSVNIWPKAKKEAFIADAARPFHLYRSKGEMPPILSDVFGGRAMTCNYCPLREVCDQTACP